MQLCLLPTPSSTATPPSRMDYVVVASTLTLATLSISGFVRVCFNEYDFSSCSTANSNMFIGITLWPQTLSHSRVPCPDRFEGKYSLERNCTASRRWGWFSNVSSTVSSIFWCPFKEWYVIPWNWNYAGLLVTHGALCRQIE